MFQDMPKELVKINEQLTIGVKIKEQLKKIVPIEKWLILSQVDRWQIVVVRVKELTKLTHFKIQIV